MKRLTKRLLEEAILNECWFHGLKAGYNTYTINDEKLLVAQPCLGSCEPRNNSEVFGLSIGVLVYTEQGIYLYDFIKQEYYDNSANKIDSVIKRTEVNWEE